MHVADSVFEGNAAPSGGALFVAYGFDLVVERTDFTNNVAWFAGGVAMGGAADIGVDGDATFSACNFTGGWGSSGGGGEHEATFVKSRRVFECGSFWDEGEHFSSWSTMADRFARVPFFETSSVWFRATQGSMA